VRFEVQSIIDGVRPFVIVRAVEPGLFGVTQFSTLNGAPVRKFDLPKAVDEAGKPRLDLYGFILERREDLAKFTVGQRVDLKG
jgi:hypothetical protein